MAASGKSIYTALMEARAKMPALVKDSTNPHFKSKYASLEAVIEVIDAPLRGSGIAWLQYFDTREDGVLALHTKLVLSDDPNQFIGSIMPVVCKDPGNPQAVAGAITYFRRYALITMCGLTPEDDDGNAAANAPQRSPEPRSEAKGTVVPDGDYDVPGYATAVKAAIDGRRGDDLLKLVDIAGDNIGRWITLVKASDTEQALDWMEKQIESRKIVSVPLNTEIGKQRAKVQQ